MLYNDSLNCFTESRDVFEGTDKNNKFRVRKEKLSWKFVSVKNFNAKKI